MFLALGIMMFFLCAIFGACVLSALIRDVRTHSTGRNVGADMFLSMVAIVLLGTAVMLIVGELTILNGGSP